MARHDIRALNDRYLRAKAALGDALDESAKPSLFKLYKSEQKCSVEPLFQITTFSPAPPTLIEGLEALEKISFRSLPSRQGLMHKVAAHRLFPIFSEVPTIKFYQLKTGEVVKVERIK
jgi:hypothetical protein